MVPQSVIVVGAGVGGLATAARLAHRGLKVTVLEQGGQVGGRNRRVTVGAGDFDGGPTLLMMLDPFRRLFADLGERMEDHLDIELCDPSYRVHYADGATIDGTPNVARMVDQIERICGRKDAERYGGFLGEIAELYRASVPNFVRRNYSSALDLASPKAVGLVLRHHMLANLARRVRGKFDDPRLHMLFSFQTMYLGLSPYDAPWVYAVLTYMEYGEGIWYPKGGLPRVSEVLAELAEARGAHVRLNAKVERVEDGRVWLAGGEELVADAVVCNADLPAAQGRLSRGPERHAGKRHSCSAYMMYVDYAGELPGLLHHNVFFGQDFKGNLDAIFRTPPRMPDDPAFYACLSARSEPGRAAPGHENLFVLVPCPNLDYAMTADDERRLQGRVFERLCQSAGFEPGRVAAMRTYGPADWERELGLSKGAAFGLSHDFWQSVCFRPDNRDRDDKRLFYVGASTVPGNGLPMVLISAELVEERILGKSQRNG